jgi:hypothetical protein
MDLNKWRVRKASGVWRVHAPGYQLRTAYAARSWRDAYQVAHAFAMRRARG